MKCDMCISDKLHGIVNYFKPFINKNGCREIGELDLIVGPLCKPCFREHGTTVIKPFNAIRACQKCAIELAPERYYFCPHCKPTDVHSLDEYYLHS